MDAIHSCDTTGCYPKPVPVAPRDSGGCGRMAGDREKSLDVAVEAPPKQAPVEEKSSAELSYKRSEKTSLFIRTQDGDVVRIRIKARESAAAEVSVSEQGESKLTELDVKARESVRIGVFVKGELDAGELEAIQSVVEQAGALANQFFSGDTSAAFAAASGLEIDGQELAKVALRLKVREQFSYSQSGPALPLPALPAPTAASDQAAPADTVSAKGESQPADDAGTEAAVASGIVRIATSTSARLFARVDATTEPAAAPAAGEALPPADSVPADSAPAPVSPDEPVAADVTPAEAADAEVAEVDPTDEAPAPTDEAPADSPVSGIGDTFELLGTVFSFLSNLIEALNPSAGEADEDSDEGEGQPGSGSDLTVSVSLRFRIFGSMVASLAETTTGSSDADPDQDEAALATLSDAVETIAAESEPAYEAVA